MYRNLGRNFITSYQVQSNVKETEEKSTEATEEINLFHPYRWFIGTVDPILSSRAIDRDNQAILAIFAWMISWNQCVTTYFLILTRRESTQASFLSLSLFLFLFRSSEANQPLNTTHPCRWQCLHERLSTVTRTRLRVFLERIGD